MPYCNFAWHKKKTKKSGLRKKNDSIMAHPYNGKTMQSSKRMIFRTIPVFLDGSPCHSSDETDEVQRRVYYYTHTHTQSINVLDYMSMGKEKDMCKLYFYIDSLG